MVNVNFREEQPGQTTAQNASAPMEVPRVDTKSDTTMVMVDYIQLKSIDVIERVTGYTDSNLSLDWMIQNAREQQEGDCVACAGT